MSENENDPKTWDEIIEYLFLDMCKNILRKDLSDHEFKFCVDSIQNTIFYLKNKRIENARNNRSDDGN
jgi:hypothetical protein